MTNFPHQHTADQFFDETQYEAYRSLGYHITKGILSGDYDDRLKKISIKNNKKEPSYYKKNWQNILLINLHNKKKLMEKESKPSNK